MSSTFFDRCREESQKYEDFIAAHRQLIENWDTWDEKFPAVTKTDLTKNPEIFWEEAEKYRTSAILFGTMCLESFIYDYAAHSFSDTYAKNYLDKLDLKGKWVVIPKLVTGKDFPTDSRAFQNLQELVKERNSLVHHKSKPMPSDKEFERIFKEALAINDKKLRETLVTVVKDEEKRVNKSEVTFLSPYETIVEVITELKRLDCDNGSESWWRLEEGDDEEL